MYQRSVLYLRRDIFILSVSVFVGKSVDALNIKILLIPSNDGLP